MKNIYIFSLPCSTKQAKYSTVFTQYAFQQSPQRLTVDPGAAYGLLTTDHVLDVYVESFRSAES